MTPSNSDMGQSRLAAHGFFRMFAIALIVIVPVTVLLGRSIWRLQSGHWFVVTIGDVLGYLSVNAYTTVIVAIGELEWDGLRDVLYYIVDEAPTEVVSLCVGVMMYVMTVVAEHRATENNQ